MAQLLLRGEPLGNFEGVLFDKDGTLSHSEPRLVEQGHSRINAACKCFLADQKHRAQRDKEQVKQLEAEGYDGLVTAETSGDPFFPLLLAAEHSERIELMTSIAVAFARSPMTIANVSNDLQSVSQGRFILGLGSQIAPHITKRFSMPWSHPAARMRVLLTFDAVVGRRHLHDSFGRVRLARTLGPPRERESLELSGQRGVELHPALRRAGGPPEPPDAAPRRPSRKLQLLTDRRERISRRRYHRSVPRRGEELRPSRVGWGIDGVDGGAVAAAHARSLAMHRRCESGGTNRVRFQNHF